MHNRQQINQFIDNSVDTTELDSWASTSTSISSTSTNRPPSRYPYLPMATNAPWSILGGGNEKSILGGMKKFNIKSVDFEHKFNN